MQRQNRPKTEQKTHWEEVFSKENAIFGEKPSEFAKKSLELFQLEGVHDVLELGCGQGRDTIFFARNGLRVTALDFAQTALETLRGRALATGLCSSTIVLTHDVRHSFPFADASFDACYSHMLLCMDLSTPEIASILGEIRRVLRPGGLALYSVRNNFDMHYRTGTHLREEIYENSGFAVHFFTEEKIRRLAKGYQILAIDRMQEGSLPRDLFCVTLRRA